MLTWYFKNEPIERSPFYSSAKNKSDTVPAKKSLQHKQCIRHEERSSRPKFRKRPDSNSLPCLILPLSPLRLLCASLRPICY